MMEAIMHTLREFNPASVIVRMLLALAAGSAIGLFAAACMGLAAGAGFYEGAIITTCFILLTQIFAAKISQHIRRAPVYHIQLLYSRR